MDTSQFKLLVDLYIEKQQELKELDRKIQKQIKKLKALGIILE